MHPRLSVKVLEQIWPSISAVLFSISDISLEAGHPQLLPWTLFASARAACREAPCWCWLAANSLHRGFSSCQLPLDGADMLIPGQAELLPGRQAGICFQLVLPSPGPRDPGLLIPLDLRPSGGELVFLFVT